MTNRGDPKKIKENMMKVASQVGANCILELTYDTEEGSEPGSGSDTHYFTVHHYCGRFAFIAKKSIKGRAINIEQINQIDNKILQNKKAISKKYSANNILYETFLFFGFFGALFYFNKDYFNGNQEFSWVSFFVILSVIGAFSGYVNNHTKCWIET